MQVSIGTELYLLSTGYHRHRFRPTTTPRSFKCNTLRHSSRAVQRRSIQTEGCPTECQEYQHELHYRGTRRVDTSITTLHCSDVITSILRWPTDECYDVDANTPNAMCPRRCLHCVDHTRLSSSVNELTTT